MEPITYANGSTLEDPADHLRHRVLELHVQGRVHLRGRHGSAGGADAARDAPQRRRHPHSLRCGEDPGRTRPRGHGVRVQRPRHRSAARSSPMRICEQRSFDLVGEEHFDREFVDEAKEVRLNNSSTQVYMALKPDERIDESTGDLLFSSTAPEFRTDLLLSRDITSRTYSFYYPRTRPAGTAALLDRLQHQRPLRRLGRAGRRRVRSEQTRPDRRRRWTHLERYVPNIRERIDHVEAATPRTFQHYTKHMAGASFGTKFEGLGSQPRTARTDPRTVSRRQRRHHHVRLAGRHQLRRDRRQRCRFPADEVVVRFEPGAAVELAGARQP